jgi:hypothetical protein
MDLGARTGGARPLHYVDVADSELNDYPALASAVAEGRRTPLALVGRDVVSPGSISYYWVVDQLTELGVPGFAKDNGGTA